MRTTYRAVVNVVASAVCGVILAGGWVAGLTGCGSPTDATMNRPNDTPTDPNYPAGPYGYVMGSTVADYKFSGKTPSDGNYSALPMRDLVLGEFHSEADVKLLLIEGSANWCYYCNQEAPHVEQMAVDFASKGVRVMTVLGEGLQRGTPSTPDDIQAWVDAHNFKKTIMAIDPEARLFQYASASAFPVHILLDTRTMSIKWLCVGGVGACDAETAVTATLAAQ